jgi:uncharacterized SAM-binding protein YcdF (DUF218 family)
MFLLSKLFNFLFIPPGLFVVMGITATVLFLIKRQRASFALFCVSIALLYALSITPVHDSLLLPLEKQYGPLRARESMEKNPEYIVVLGGGLSGGGPDSGELHRAELSNTAYKRLGHAFVIHRLTGLPIIITGGRVYPQQKKEPEATVAKRALMEFGTDPSLIITETRSRNTWENARYVKEMTGGPVIILVTSAFHMPRSVLSFEAYGIEAVPAPTDFRVDQTERTFTDYLPSMGRLYNCSTALHEHIGLLYYRLKKLL